MVGGPVNISLVCKEIADRIDAIPGLRVTDYDADAVHPPAAFVGVPDRVTFDSTYGRGADAATVPVLVLVGRADARSAYAELKPYADGSGERSIKAAVDSTNVRPYTSCDIARVSTVEFNVYVLGNVKYLAAEFTVDIEG